jgi:hypothetical protein
MRRLAPGSRPELELLLLFVVMVAGVVVVGLMAGIIVGRRLDALVARPDPDPDPDPEAEPVPGPELPEDIP